MEQGLVCSLEPWLFRAQGGEESSAPTELTWNRGSSEPLLIRARPLPALGPAPASPTHRLDDLVTLFDHFVDLPQGVHLGVLQLLLLSIRICHAGAVRGHRLFSLRGGRARDGDSSGARRT